MTRSPTKRNALISLVAAIALSGCVPVEPHPGPAVPTIDVGSEDFAWVPITSDPLAVCNDGSEAGYWFRPSPTGSSTWVIMLRGGGYCATMEPAGLSSCDPETDPGCVPSPSCLERSADLFSSDGQPSTMQDTSFLPHSNSPEDNPDFYDANHVYVPYCSSDVHSGDASVEYEVGGQPATMHFRGKRIIASLIEQLKSPAYTPGATLALATDVLVGGSSAGGVGVIANLDRIAAALPEANVRGVTDAGWFPELGPMSGGASFEERFSAAIELWGGQPDDSCMAAEGDALTCYLGARLLPYVEAPLFVYMAQRDKNIVTEMGGIALAPPYDPEEIAYIQGFAAAVVSSVLPSAAGYFLPDRSTHTALKSADRYLKDRIEGRSYRDALTDWFFDRPGPVQLIEGGGGPQGALTPVFVTLAGHIEDSPSYAKCPTYTDRREKLLFFADRVAGAGATLNLQIEYELLKGARDCETAELMASTGGTNAIDYLASLPGFEIDAHQEGATEEGENNYADVRFIAGQVTSLVTDTVGGILWDDPDQLFTLAAGESGWLYPEFSWAPDILTLAVSTKHHFGNFSEDDNTSGVWMPKGPRADFLTHDPTARMAYVGSGLQHSNWGGGPDCDFHDGADYVETLIDYLDAGKIPSGRMYTATIAIPQSIIFDSSRHAELMGMLEQLAPHVAAGRVVYATYTEVVQIWKESYDAEPNILPYDAIDPADYTCK